MASNKNHTGYFSRKALQEAYGIHRNTFRIELQKIKGLNLVPKQKILSPDQVKKIFNHLGNPFE